MHDSSITSYACCQNTFYLQVPCCRIRPSEIDHDRITPALQRSDMAKDVLSNLAAFARLPGRHRVFAGVGLLTFLIIAHLLFTERIPYRFQPQPSFKGSYRPLHGHRLSLGPYLEPWRANLHGLLHDDGSFLDAESLSLEETDELDEQGRAGLQRLSELAWSETESGQADRASIDRGTMTASRRMELAGRIEELVAHYKVSYYM